LSVVTVSGTRRAREKEARDMSSGIAKMIAHFTVTGITAGLNIPDRVLDEHLRNAFALNKAIAYIVITDEADRLKAGRVNKDLVTLATNMDERKALEVLARQGQGAAEGLSICSVRIDDGKNLLGAVKVAFNLRPIQEEMRREVTRYLVVTVLLLALGIGGSCLFAEKISRPVERLVDAMRQVREGNLDATVDIRNRDEIGLLARSFNFMSAGLKEREWLKITFAKYVSRQVAEKILQEKKECDFEGELRKVTVMFCDIRGFTPLAESLGPKDVVALLNEYFTIMIDIVFKYDGTLDKFVGDQIMAVFGAPLDQDNTELRAVRTAAEIQQAVMNLNVVREQRGQPVVHIGIGINTGEAVAGNVGSEARTSYTVIGDEVNLAQRIESQSPKGEILISDRTYEAVKDYVEVTPLGKLTVKGREAPVEVYSVNAVRV